MQLSNLLKRVKEPQTILMAKLSRELKSKGIQVIDLSIGEPDFATPPHIKEAAIVAMQEGYTKYPPVAGYPDLRKAICEKLKRDNNLDYIPEQIIVSTGAKQSLANIIFATINPGDEVIIPTPYWVTYGALVEMNEGVCKYIPCDIEDHFKLTAEKLEKAITDKTKMFIFSSPCNPTGAVYTREELEALKNVFIKYPEITIVSDEIYEYINYNGKHESIAQFKELKDQIALVNGFSKGYAMTGWRLGYMAAPVELAKACEKIQSQITSGANSIAQRAAIAALNGDMEPTQSMVKAFKERKEYFVSSLQNIEGIKLKEPDGAFYAFANIASFFGKSDGDTIINHADDFAMYLLNKGHVAGVSGSAFGNDFCIRFSFAASMNSLKEGVLKIKDALSKLK